MSEDLEQFVKENTRFVKLEDGSTFTGKLMGMKRITNKFDSTKQAMEYEFETNDKRLVTWTTGSLKVAREVLKYKPGAILAITRHGEGTQTKYKIEKKAEDVPF